MKRKIHRELENPWKSFIWGLNPTGFRLRFPFNHSLELSLVSYRFHHFHPKGHNWGIYGVYSTPSSRPQTYRDFIPTVRPCSACSRKRPWDTALFAWSNVIPATKTHQIWDMDRNGVFAPKDGTFCGNVGNMIFSAITCFGGAPFNSLHTCLRDSFWISVLKPPPRMWQEFSDNSATTCTYQ